MIWQGCGSSSKNNLGEKIKIYPQVLTFLITPQIWLFPVFVLLTTTKKWTKVKNARAGLAKPSFCPLNVQICDFLVTSPLSLLKLRSLIGSLRVRSIDRIPE